MSGTASDVTSFKDSLDWETRGRTDALVIRAGAGAGKTTELVKRVLSLILRFRAREQRFPRLVITTFTRKATQELRERLLLGALALGDEEVLRFVQQSKSLQISTIHGTLRRFLSSFGPAAGLSPEFRIMDELSESRLRKKSLRQVLEDPEQAVHFESLLENWDLGSFWNAFAGWSELTAVHPEAVAETAADVEAGVHAHFRKLEAACDDYFRIAALEEKLPPNRVEFIDWLGAIVGHAKTLAPALKRAHWLEALEDRPRAYTTKLSPAFKEAQVLVYDLWNEIEGDDFSNEFIQDYAAALEHFLPLAGALRERIETEKARRSELALADLELWTLKILNTHPESGTQFGEQWDYWMIDEFQDTSPLQVKILGALVGGKNEFVVGDPQQSIYLFRGARSEVFELKETSVTGAGGRNSRLMKNYRSSPKLMNFLNRFLCEIEPRQFAPMEIGGGADKDLAQGPQVVFWSLPKDAVAEENDAVLARVQELLRAGVAAEKICVLARGNKELRDFCQLAEKHGVPTRFSGAAGFAERREVRDALAFLKFLANPHDNLSLMTLLRSPWFHVNDRELAQLKYGLRGSYWLAAQTRLKEPSGGGFGETSAASLRSLQASLNLADEKGLTQAWVETLLNEGFIDESLKLDASGQRESHFWRLLADLKFQEREPGFNILKWIEQLEVGQITDEKSDDEAPAVIEPSRVQVMTIHASKGLQFDHVILTRAGTARFAVSPGVFKADEMSGKFSLGVRGARTGSWLNSGWAYELMETEKAREVAEFDRFLYVALTRAIQSVSVVWKREVSASWMARRPTWSILAEGLHTLADDGPAFDLEIRHREPALEVFERKAETAGRVRELWKVEEPLAERPREIAAASGWSRFEKIQNGVDVHRALELLQGDWEYDDAAEMVTLKEKLEKVEGVSMRQLIEEGFVEWAFLVKVDGAKRAQPEFWMSGRIDLWGLIKGADGRDEVWIVDYKTGTSRSRDSAIAQLRSYAWTLYRMNRIPEGARVKLLPLYLNEPQATRSEDAPSFADLDENLLEILASRK
ncbi:MAG: UvrD-helicase domain-containing protein [Bdellovibrionaceae bacterium]|nr:UvrD-helicase domain-containing protein [Pseudobdellovibrionaceae bacterium]